MRILFIDIVSHEGALACCTEHTVVCVKPVHHRIRDDELVPIVEALLIKAQWTYEDITHIACIIGPGGFTSLRVAAAFANTLRWILDISIAGIHLSDLYIARVQQEDFLWIHSTKKNELFVRGGKWINPTHVHIKDIPDDIQWMGELLPQHIRDSWKAITLKDVRKILPNFLTMQDYTKEMVKPWYGREG